MNRASSWSGVVEDVRRALAPQGRRQLGVFAVEGTRLVERALRSGRAPKRAIVAESAARRDPRVGDLLMLLREAGCEVVPVPDAITVELADERQSGVVFGLCEIPTQLSCADLAKHAVGTGPVLVLVDVTEPGNVGALVRTALAAGASGVVALGASDPYHPKAVRTSMGSLFKIPIVHQYEIEAVLAQLSPLRRLAAVSAGGAEPWEAQLEPEVAFFVGQEANGLPANLVSRLDGTVTIPMTQGVDSFSVNAAAAVLLYEVTRRRRTAAG